MASNSLGYDEGMFFGEVRESLQCSICLNVLKDPKMCREKEHVFCRECITRHLAINQTCPVCREPLTVATLRPPARFLMECWSDLQIKCQYYERGCTTPVRLCRLHGHVAACEFAGVPCTNDGCDMVVNRKDLCQHKEEQCRFRRGAKCPGCVEVKKEVKELKDEMRRNQEMVLEHLEGINAKFDEMKTTTKTSAETMQGNLVRLEASVGKVMANQTDLQQQFQKISITGSFPQACAQQSEKQTLQNNDIFIFGGETDKEQYSSSGEKFCWGTGQWSELPEMRDGRQHASCFVSGPEVFVAGGLCRDGRDYRYTDNIETLNCDEKPLQWRQFGGKLPETLRSHQTVVSCNKAIVTGGIGRNYMFSNNISELQLDRPYSGKVLCKMAVERAYHCCVVVGDKVFYLGGRNGLEDVLKSVCMFDVQTNKCTELPPLPYAVCEMSTVVCGRIFVIGGDDGNGNKLNKVFSYDVETGESEMLPPMKYKRCGCSAVAARDGFVVMGGLNEGYKLLNSVEYFKLSTGSWLELAPMIQPRSDACAVVKP